MSKIGLFLKQARTNAGLTQKEVEARLGLRDLMMKDYETGRIKLPLEMAARLAELYKLGLDDLVPTELITSKVVENSQLSQLSYLFDHTFIRSMNQDAVIRAHMEEVMDQVLDLSYFDLVTSFMTSREKSALAAEIVKTLGSLMGADKKISDSEMFFFRTLVSQLGIDSQNRTISRALTVKYLPKPDTFMNRPVAKHFLLWLMFFLASSDGEIVEEELDYIKECAEVLKVNRSNYLLIKKNFVKEKY